MVSQHTIKKEFNDFAQKVSTLQRLRHELNALSAKEFPREVASIRSKLKDTSAIPQIKRELTLLKKKIDKKHVSHHRSQHHTVANRRLLKETQQMKRKITSLQRLIEKKKKVSVRKQLNRQELQYVKDIPKLERMLRQLNRDFKQHTSSGKVKIDSGVGVIVDSRFDDFVLGIKSELTQQLKKKELAVDDQLKHDLATRKKEFANRYKQLVSEFHNKYKKRVDTQLRRDVDKKFKLLLSERLEREKKRLVNTLVKENIQRLEKERKILERDLHNEYSKREQSLRSILDRDRQKLQQRLQSVRDKETILSRTIKKQDSQKKQLQARFQKQKKQELQKIKNLKQTELDNISAMKERELSTIEKERKEILRNARLIKQEHLAKLRALKKKELETISARKSDLSKKETALKALEMHKKDEFEKLQKRHDLILHRRLQEMERREQKLRKNLTKKTSQQRATQLRKIQEMRNTELSSLRNLRQKEIDKLNKKHETLQRKAVALKQNETKRKRHLVKLEREIARSEQKHEAVYRRQSAELDKQEKVLRDEFEKRKQRLQSKLVSVRASADQTIKKREKELASKLSDMAARFAKDQVTLDAERQNLENQRKLLSKQLEKAREHYKINLKRAQTEHQKNLHSQVRAYKDKLQKDYSQKVSQLHKENATLLKKQIIEMKKQVTKQLDKEYKEHYNKELAKKLTALHKQKSELEQHIMKQVQSMFK